MTQKEKSDCIKQAIDLVLKANEGKPFNIKRADYYSAWKLLDGLVGSVDALKLIFYYNIQSKKVDKSFYKPEEVYS